MPNMQGYWDGQKLKKAAAAAAGIEGVDSKPVADFKDPTYIANANAQNAATMAAAKTGAEKERAALVIAGNDNTDMGKVLLAGAQGQEIGNQFFGEGSLGRVSEGFSDARSLALKTRAQKEAANAGRIAQRQATVAQAKSGMSGGAAAFQMADLNNQRAQQQAVVSRDIFLADEQQRRQDRVFNLEQAAREKAGRLGTTMGFMQMQQGLLTADKSAQAIMNAPTGGGSKGGLISGIFGAIGL